MALKLENNIGSKFNLTHANNASEISLTSKDLASTKLVDSIAELKLINGSTADKLEVLGYYEKGDGGGGLFYWDATSTEVDNGGTIIQATGVTTGRWKRVFSGDVIVKWFGAVGDGVTDDTNAIQSAIHSISTSDFFSGVHTGGIVYLPRGTYKITTLNLSSQVSLVGEDKSKTILYASGTDYCIKLAESLTASRSYDTNIKNLMITGIVPINLSAATISTTSSGIYAPSTIGMCIENVAIYNLYGTGIYLGSAGDVYLSFLDILYCDKGLDIQKYGTDTSNAIHVVGCRIEGSDTFNVNIYGGDSQCRDINFSGCKLENGKIYIQNANGISFTSSSIICAEVDDFTIEVLAGDLSKDTRNVSFTGCLFTSGVANTGKAINSTCGTSPVIINSCVVSTLKEYSFVGDLIFTDNSIYDAKLPLVTIDEGYYSNNYIDGILSQGDTSVASEASGVVGYVKRSANVQAPRIYNHTSGGETGYTGSITGDNIYKNISAYPVLITYKFKSTVKASALINVEARMGIDSGVSQGLGIFTLDVDNTLGSEQFISFVIPSGYYFKVSTFLNFTCKYTATPMV